MKKTRLSFKSLLDKWVIPMSALSFFLVVVFESWCVDCVYSCRIQDTLASCGSGIRNFNSHVRGTIIGLSFSAWSHDDKLEDEEGEEANCDDSKEELLHACASFVLNRVLSLLSLGIHVVSIVGHIFSIFNYKCSTFWFKRLFCSWKSNQTDSLTDRLVQRNIQFLTKLSINWSYYNFI